MESIPLKIIPETDEQLTEVLKASIEHEKEKRKINRPSWKTEYELVFKIKEKYRVQRNLAVALAACYLLVDLIFKIFS